MRFLRPSNWFLAAAIPWLIYIILLCPVLGLAADFSGLVVSVLDGDTLEVLHNDRPERIRLSGIDCPEKGQAYGTRAKQAASELVLGGEVTLQTYGHDKYGRTLADVILLDGTNVNHTLVEDGWCWWYRKYAPGDTVLEALETEAREAKKGLWADPQPVPPWEWRKKTLTKTAIKPPFCRGRGGPVPIAVGGVANIGGISPHSQEKKNKLTTTEGGGGCRKVHIPLQKTIRSQWSSMSKVSSVTFRQRNLKGAQG